jgi:hypothetical protein
MYFASAILGNIDSKTFVSAQLLGTDGSSGATTSSWLLHEASNRERVRNRALFFIFILLRNPDAKSCSKKSKSVISKEI